MTDTINQDKFYNTFNRIVDETENKNTVCNYTKNLLLTKLLDLFEYLMDNEEENPVDKWFDQ